MYPQKRILCVDDTPDVREMLCALLTHHGYRTQAVDNFASAIDLARREPFDLYILDSRFPGGSGLDLCCDLRVITHAPIIFYSGAVFPADHHAALAYGAQAYVAKPHLNHLLEAVRLALDVAEPLTADSALPHGD